jgi:hypothetical protein
MFKNVHLETTYIVLWEENYKIIKFRLNKANIIIPIPSEPGFPLTPKNCLHSGDATNTSLIVFDLTRSRLRNSGFIMVKARHDIAEYLLIWR